MPEFSLSESEAITEVRDALAGLDQSKIPDSTIQQSLNRFSKPWVDQQVDPDAPQEVYEGAVIAYAAELSFNSWMMKTRMRDAELEVFTDPRVFKDKIQRRTDEVFTTLGISRPPRNKHYQKAVKADDE